jgi:hypothetical protein
MEIHGEVAGGEVDAVNVPPRDGTAQTLPSPFMERGWG